MRFFKLHHDELIVSDGSTHVLVMARGKLDVGAQDYVQLEIESTVGDRPMCKGCTEEGLTSLFDMCDPCMREVIPK